MEIPWVVGFIFRLLLVLAVLTGIVVGIYYVIFTYVLDGKGETTLGGEKIITDEDIAAEQKAAEEENLSNLVVEDLFESISGNFEGIDEPVSGHAVIYKGNGASYLILQDFSIRSVEDLDVYLSTDGSGDVFIDLGELKQVNEKQTYLIPQGTDVDRYDTVLIWDTNKELPYGIAQLQ